MKFVATLAAVLSLAAASTVHAAGLRPGVAKLTRHQAHMLQADCSVRQYKTVAQFASGF